MFRVEPFDLWPGWARLSLNEMIKCEDKANCTYFDGGDRWADEALFELIKNSFPTLLRLRIQVSGSYCLGAISGHQEWIIDNAAKFFPPDEILDLMIEKLEECLDQLFKILTPEQQALLIKQIRQNQAAIIRLCRAYDRACVLKKAQITKILDRSIHNAQSSERLEFLDGYTKAYKKPAIKKPAELAPREKMLSVILLDWKTTQETKNRTILRERLGVIFNQPGVYNHEFVQGVCKDVGLNLKGKGREKK